MMSVLQWASEMDDNYDGYPRVDASFHSVWMCVVRVTWKSLCACVNPSWKTLKWITRGWRPDWRSCIVAAYRRRKSWRPLSWSFRSSCEWCREGIIQDMCVLDDFWVMYCILMFVRASLIPCDSNHLAKNLSIPLINQWPMLEPYNDQEDIKLFRRCDWVSVSWFSWDHQHHCILGTGQLCLNCLFQLQQTQKNNF